jgi:PPOX class probable F420-dependent enzyme
MAKLSDEQAQLFLDRNYGHVGTIRPDGSAHVTPVWVDYDGEHVIFNTAVGRAKYRYLQRDPRVTIEVQNLENPYEYVLVSGRAEMEEGDEAEKHIDKLAKKYRGLDVYPDHSPDRPRVLVRVKPELVLP